MVNRNDAVGNKLCRFKLNVSQNSDNRNVSGNIDWTNVIGFPLPNGTCVPRRGNVQNKIFTRWLSQFDDQPLPRLISVVRRIFDLPLAEQFG